MQENAPYDVGRGEPSAVVDDGPRELAEVQPAQRRGFSIARREGPWRDALLRRMLALADLLAGIAASSSVAVATRGRLDAILWAGVLAPTWVVVAKLLGLYDRDQRSLRHLTVDELPSLFTWALTSTAAVALLLAVTPAGGLNAGEALRVGIVGAGASLVLRWVARAVWRRLTPPESAVLIGNPAARNALRRKLELFPDIHLSIASTRAELTMDDLADPLAAFGNVDRIVLASPPLDEELIAELVAFCRRRQMKLTVIPSMRGFFGTGVELRHVADLPVLEYNTWDVSRSTQLLKRLIDVVVASVALVALSPLLGLIALGVLIETGRPVLFVQVRAGQGARPFKMLKFRTMVRGAQTMLEELLPLGALDEPVFKLRSDPRVTRFGSLLRRTSLDELPQLANVLVGTMSLVGPRPEQFDLVERYAAHHSVRLAVKPGMTGPMQVYGRGELTFEERLAVEHEYVENLSVARDLHILAMTVASLLHRRGAY
jgi:exopolysaccharide biosynthesis polyprenyl glycosylphosphotransferase